MAVAGRASLPTQELFIGKNFKYSLKFTMSLSDRSFLPDVPWQDVKPCSDIERWVAALNVGKNHHCQPSEGG